MVEAFERGIGEPVTAYAYEGRPNGVKRVPPPVADLSEVIQSQTAGKL